MNTVRERAGRKTPLALAPVALAALALAALAGCVKVDADLSIEGDWVDGTLTTALDREVAETLELDPEQVFTGPDSAVADLAQIDGVSQTPYEDAGWSGTEHTLDRVHLDELNQVAEGDPESLRIVRDQPAGTYEFTMVMDLTGLTDLADPDAEPDHPDAPDFRGVLDSFEATIVMTFPGEVIDHNGELDGTTVSWHPEPGERAEMRAVARDPDADPDAPPPGADPDPDRAGDTLAPAGDADSGGAGMTTVLLAAALVVLAAAGLGVGLLVRSRRRPAEPAETTEPAETAPDTEPAPDTGSGPAPDGNTDPAEQQR